MKMLAESADEACKALRDLSEVSGFRPLIVKCLDFITNIIEPWFKKNK